MKENIVHGNLMDVYNYSAMIKNQSEMCTQNIDSIPKSSQQKIFKKVYKKSNYKRR